MFKPPRLFYRDLLLSHKPHNKLKYSEKSTRNPINFLSPTQLKTKKMRIKT